MAAAKPKGSKLLSFKEWLTVDEAARHFSTLFGEQVTRADIFQLALEKKLKLSVRLVVEVPAKLVRFESLNEARLSIVPRLFAPPWKGSPLPENGVTTGTVKDLPEDIREALRNGTLMLLPHGTLHGTDQLLVVADEAISLSGLCDLPMIGAEVLDVESLYQQETNGPEFDLWHLEGAFVESNGVCYQLQDELESSESYSGSTAQLDEFKEHIKTKKLDADAAQKLLDRHAELRKARLKKMASGQTLAKDYYPAAHIPDDAVFVVRTAALLDFERQASNPQAVAGAIIGLREAATYLNIIGALVELLLGKTPTGKRNSVYESQASVIDALATLHPGKSGLATRTLQEKFAEAKRSLAS